MPLTVEQLLENGGPALLVGKDWAEVKEVMLAAGLTKRDWADAQIFAALFTGGGGGGGGGAAFLSGNGAPDSGTGNNGDVYFDKTNKAFYGPKTLGNWGSGTSLKGDKGDTGDTGAAGAQGAQGPQGATGETGAQGPQGDAGPQGDQGPQGPQGDPGADAVWNGELDFDVSALSADNTYQGIVIAGINAGETIAQWDTVVLAADGEWYKADADAVGLAPCGGIAVEAGSDGNPLKVLKIGIIRRDAWNWTRGPNGAGDIFLSDTAGGMVQSGSIPSTSGDVVQKLAEALTADIIYFNATGEWMEVE